MSTEQTIPHKDNPAHVENLASITLLEAQGFEGPDASLNESLFEYGLAWRDIGEELLFIYRHPSMPKRFDRGTMRKDLDVRKEYDWADFDAVLSFVGMEPEEWDKLPLTHKLQDMLGYYGEEEIFGSSYWEGFAISEE